MFSSTVKAFDAVLKEYFLLTDVKTSRKMNYLTEQEQSKTLLQLTSKLYEVITNKVMDIDFGNIPETKGDFSKLPEYMNILDTLELVRGIVNEYHEDLSLVNILDTAINNIVTRANLFTLAYKTNAELPIIMYNTISLSIISSLSLLISGCVQYIKEGTDTFKIAYDKVAAVKTKDSILFTNLDRFNKTCANGTLDKAMNNIIKADDKQLLGITAGFYIANAVILAAIAIAIIPFLRELIYFFYYTRVKISDYFNAQADLLLMNSMVVERTTADPKRAKVIAEKQKGLADSFRKFSNKVKVEMTTSETTARNTIKTDTKKYKADEILGSEDAESKDSLF